MASADLDIFWGPQLRGGPGITLLRNSSILLFCLGKKSLGGGDGNGGDFSLYPPLWFEISIVYTHA